MKWNECGTARGNDHVTAVMATYDDGTDHVTVVMTVVVST